MGKRFDGPVRLDDHAFTLPEVAAISGVGQPAIRNWLERGTLKIGDHRSLTGRRVFCLADAVRLATMHSLITRVTVRASDAVGVAELVTQEILKLAPCDANGRPLVDPASIPATLALTFAVIEGETQVGLIDPERPGYTDWRGSWGDAHILIPIAAALHRVIHNLITLSQRAAPEPVA